MFELLLEIGLWNKDEYRQSRWLCTSWGEIAQSFNFKYLYENHCKSYELLWSFKGYPIIKSTTARRICSDSGKDI